MKSSSKVSDADSGMSTFGPTSESNGGTVTDVSVVDQQGRVSKLEPSASLGGRGV